MAPSDCLGETWEQLCVRIGAVRLAGWAGREPLLAGSTDLPGLASVVQSGPDRARADAVLGALLRLAAADGGDEPDAALVVAHLMSPAARAIAVSLRDLSADIDALVAGELWLQIRAYRWRQRHSGHAFGLRSDTRAALLRELAPARDGDGQRRQVPVSPELAGRLADTRTDPAPDPDPDAELFELLDWARRTGLLSGDDLRLLLDFELASADQRAATAARHGHTDRHLRRRCTQVKHCLHQARHSYLARTA